MAGVRARASQGAIGSRCLSVMSSSLFIVVSSNAVLAAALTRPKQKSPERSRGPGCGWAQCAYAEIVSWVASFQSSGMCSISLCKRARILRMRMSEVNPFT